MTGSSMRQSDVLFNLQAERSDKEVIALNTGVQNLWCC